MAIRVSVDAMGGDHAPEMVVPGIIRALRKDPELEIQLFGPEDRLHSLLSGSSRPVERLQVIHAPDIVGMGDSPAAALKNKPDSSIHRGLESCKRGDSSAFVSAGNTGAVMAASLFILGRQARVKRPSLVGYFPTLQGHCILLDAGANVDCKPETLVQFAKMGSVYVQKTRRTENPSIGLMNIGEEPGKGNEQAKITYDLLKSEETLNFVGNIEGRDVLRHAADVVIADGYVGNIMLKFGESVATIVPQMVGAEMTRIGMSPEDQQVVARALKGVRDRFDFQEYGGAPLLGVNGSVIIGHGGSNELAFENMITHAAEMVRENVSESISEALSA
jgi:glycerol-3-phosphate acyltransferase PlsX